MGQHFRGTPDFRGRREAAFGVLPNWGCPRNAFSPQARKWPFHFLISFCDQKPGAAFFPRGWLTRVDPLTPQASPASAAPQIPLSPLPQGQPMGGCHSSDPWCEAGDYRHWQAPQRHQNWPLQWNLSILKLCWPPCAHYHLLQPGELVSSFLLPEDLAFQCSTPASGACMSPGREYSGSSTFFTSAKALSLSPWLLPCLPRLHTLRCCFHPHDSNWQFALQHCLPRDSRRSLRKLTFLPGWH